MGFADKAKQILREMERAESAEPTARPLPFINQSGDLVIPFDCDLRYKWWASGQSVTKTIEEVRAVWKH